MADAVCCCCAAPEEELPENWKEKIESYREKYKGDEAMVSRQLQKNRFIIPEKSTFDYLYDHRNEPNLGEIIDGIAGRIPTIGEIITLDLLSLVSNFILVS